MPECDYIHVRRAGRGVGIEPMFTNVALWFAELDRFGPEPFTVAERSGPHRGPRIFGFSAGRMIWN
jgi:hypothetical protein